MSYQINLIKIATKLNNGQDVMKTVQTVQKVVKNVLHVRMGIMLMRPRSVKRIVISNLVLYVKISIKYLNSVVFVKKDIN